MNVVAGIEIALGVPVDILGMPAVSTFPGFPRYWLPGAKWRHVEKLREDESIAISTLPILKQATQFLGVFFGVLRWLWNYRKLENRVVFVYESYIPSLCGASLACFALSAPMIVLIADPPGGATASRSLRGR